MMLKKGYVQTKDEGFEVFSGYRDTEPSLSPEEAIDAFLQKKLRGAELSDPKVRRRAADALARRGYRWEDISAGLRRYGAEPEEW